MPMDAISPENQDSKGKHETEDHSHSLMADLVNN